MNDTTTSTTSTNKCDEASKCDEQENANIQINSQSHSQSQSSTWNDFDEYTLTLMSNRSHYGKYIKAKVGPNGETVKHDVSVNDGHSIHYATTFKKEKKYYKKRIIALTKDLYNKKFEDDKDITEPFNEYLKRCIKYLKFKDVSEMIQNDYKDINSEIELKRAQSELNKRIDNDTGRDNKEDHSGDEKDNNELGEQDKTVDNANKIFMRRSSTLDNFVKIKKPGELYVQPPPKQVVFPQIKEFNIDMMNNAEKKQKKIKKQVNNDDINNNSNSNSNDN
jgi:hypothetical protein